MDRNGGSEYERVVPKLDQQAHGGCRLIPISTKVGVQEVWVCTSVVGEKANGTSKLCFGDFIVPKSLSETLSSLRKLRVWVSTGRERRKGHPFRWRSLDRASA